ncbi:amidase domain-containing protein [Niallia sp. 01092]|uniref:amidase domain-containing protein n=1 Tax=unclassified Niallia TaxID=2837522 RepID=UPI003FD53B84
MKQQLLEFLEKRMQQYVSFKRSASLEHKMERKKKLFQKRQAEIVKVKATGKITSVENVQETEEVYYRTHVQYIIKQHDFFYIEEEIEKRKASFYKGVLIEDKEIPVSYQTEEHLFLNQTEESLNDEETERGYTYNRLKAVQYAEKWWNSYNPAYKRFEVDCTNYISQCVHAGGAPMRGYPNRNTGWWMQHNSWSYSWAVANAFPKYLATSKKGLRARQVAKATDLLLGDVICYDFEGDGKYNHTTIVTGKDDNGEPLVNAHTYNSRNRYWAYEDSTAYTPNIQYKFFTIIDG